MRYLNGLTILLSVILALVASYRDIATRRISNRITATAFLAALALKIDTVLAADRWVLLAGSLVWASFMMALFFAGWLLRLWGAGDAKLAGVFSFLLPPLGAAQMDFGLGTLLVGGVLAIIYLILARQPARPARTGTQGKAGCGAAAFAWRLLRVEFWRARRGRGLPYGVAIGIAGVCVVLTTSAGMV